MLGLEFLISSFINTWPFGMLKLKAVAHLLRQSSPIRSVYLGQVGGDSTHEFDLRLAQCRK